MKRRPTRIDRTAPRYVIRTSRGHGQAVGFSWSEPWGRREAQRLAEARGEPLVLLDEWKRRLVKRYCPSPAAVARRAAIKPNLTAGGKDADQMHAFFLGTRPRLPREQPLSDRAEDPASLPLLHALPGDFLLDADLR